MTSQQVNKSTKLLMVRHTAVDESYAWRCYGASDLGLSPEGAAQVAGVAEELSDYCPDRIYHSGLQRARVLANATAEVVSTDIEMIADARLAELNFGQWEGLTWDEIFASGHDIARLIHEPETFAPPDGETTFALRDRVLAWFESVPRKGVTIAVAHGGTICALRGTLLGLPAADWPALMPALGEIVPIESMYFG